MYGVVTGVGGSWANNELCSSKQNFLFYLNYHQATSVAALCQFQRDLFPQAMVLREAWLLDDITFYILAVCIKTGVLRAAWSDTEGSDEWVIFIFSARTELTEKLNIGLNSL